MNNYFYNMVDPDEMATLEYIPTIPKFLEFIKKQYSDYPAISDKVTTYTYEELVSRVAKRVTFINSLGLEKGSNIAVQRTILMQWSFSLQFRRPDMYLLCFLMHLTIRHLQESA